MYRDGKEISGCQAQSGGVSGGHDCPRPAADHPLRAGDWNRRAGRLGCTPLSEPQHHSVTFRVPHCAQLGSEHPREPRTMLRG